jgi:hypothetical protein
MVEVISDSNDAEQGTVSLAERRRAKEHEKLSFSPVRIRIEVACREDVGGHIESCLMKELNRTGSLVVRDDRPDWMLSVIAFSAGRMVELSIVLRKFFRSTSPGTEMSDQQDGPAALRGGGWLYESLRYHGLFGVSRSELEAFLTGLVREFTAEHLREGATEHPRRGLHVGDQS